MGRQIIKQPNGRYCIFSSIVDNVTHYNMEPKDIIKEWVKDEAEAVAKRVNLVIERLSSGEKPYSQFTKSFDEMINLIMEIHGDKEADNVSKMIDPQNE